MSNILVYEVKFQSYNPFPLSFPGRRVISRETLHVIKKLREKGIPVRVVPEGGELNYLAEKGIRDFLQDPLYATLINVPLSVVASIVATMITNHWAAPPAPQETHIVLEVQEDGQKLKYDHLGQPVSDEKFKAMLNLMQERARLSEAARRIPSPHPDKPVPIFLEHTHKIAGWGRVGRGDGGLIVEDAIITDGSAAARVRSGDLGGFSIACLVRRSTCQYCKDSYFSCNHIAGQVYAGEECVNQIEGADLIEVSIVKDPVNLHCKIELGN
ncbi:MAG TPA: hypothetical protein VI298_05610 [Geobacteraceae bacterium]